MMYRHCSGHVLMPFKLSRDALPPKSTSVEVDWNKRNDYISQGTSMKDTMDPATVTVVASLS